MSRAKAVVRHPCVPFDWMHHNHSVLIFYFSRSQHEASAHGWFVAFFVFPGVMSRQGGRFLRSWFVRHNFHSESES